jgi:hypothetical protein
MIAHRMFAVSSALTRPLGQGIAVRAGVNFAAAETAQDAEDKVRQLLTGRPDGWVVSSMSTAQVPKPEEVL